MSDLILRLAVPSPLRRLFDYLPPKGCDPEALQPGIRLLVPFGNRKLIGLLLEVSDRSEFPSERLKPALEQLDEHPLLPEHLLKLSHWAARYYQHPPGDALLNVLPVLLRRGEPAEYRSQHLWRVTDSGAADASQLPARAYRQHQALALLRQHPLGLDNERLKALDINSATLKSLAEKNLVERIEQVPPSRTWPKQLLHEPPLTLNEEQQAALNSMQQHTGFRCYLLDGVTGSGKTEVYLQLIQQCLNKGQQALVMVPEIGLTPQTLARFRQRFSVPISVLHSGLNDRERLDAWLQANDGSAGIIIGTRSALFTPLKRPGVIIIDEEHDASFKQQDGFRYSARDLAVIRARDEQIPILLGSATPSLESLHNAQAGRYHWLKLRKRAGNAQPPAFTLLDMRREPLEDGLSTPLLKEIALPLARGEQVLVFINRRGFAPTLMCHDCGWIADCPQCDAHLTVHRAPAHLHCHHCDHQMPLHRYCPSCQSGQLNPLGAGTERTEEALRRHFPDVPILRVDRDSTRRKSGMQKIMQQVHEGKPCILVGTQMLAKGHHFPRVTLVAILDADAGLFSADFRGMEKMAQLILQVAGRAGRADLPGRVLMQTHHADHPQLTSLIDQGYHSFAQMELTQRRAADLPPYRHLALLRAEALAPGRAEAFLHVARLIAEQLGTGPIQLLGPLPSPMEKRAGRYRAQLLFQCDDRGPLHRHLATLAQELEENRQAKQVRWSLDVDPMDLF